MVWPWWVNGIIFQVGWSLAVLGGDTWALIACLCVLLLHFIGFVRSNKEWLLILGISLLGCLIDSSLFAVGVLVNNDGSLFMPLWLVCVWLIFSTSLCHLFSWLHYKLWLAAALGAVFAPLSYWGGALWTDVSIVESYGLLTLAAIWLLLFPSSMFLARRIYGQVTE